MYIMPNLPENYRNKESKVSHRYILYDNLIWFTENHAKIRYLTYKLTSPKLKPYPIRCCPIIAIEKNHHNIEKVVRNKKLYRFILNSF